MPRKPAASAFILALTLRRVWQKNEKRIANVREYNEKIRGFNKTFAENGLPLYEELPDDDSVFWRSVVSELEGMKDVSEGLAIVTDADYRAVIFDAVKQPYHKVRGSKGFANLVPVLETIRRYGPYDPEQPMDMTEEEARELADLIWAQEMEPFIEEGRGVDPINKQIIANKVSAELKESNVKYIGEQILNCEFNDVELDMYEVDHKDALDILRSGIEAAYELFNYEPANTTRENRTWVRQAVVMYDSMFKKERTDEQLDDLVDSIICAFEYLYQLIE